MSPIWLAKPPGSDRVAGATRSVICTCEPISLKIGPVLRRVVADQAVLRGILAQIRDLGLPLLCLACAES